MRLFSLRVSIGKQRDNGVFGISGILSSPSNWVHLMRAPACPTSSMTANIRFFSWPAVEIIRLESTALTRRPRPCSAWYKLTASSTRHKRLSQSCLSTALMWANRKLCARFVPLILVNLMCLPCKFQAKLVVSTKSTIQPSLRMNLRARRRPGATEQMCQPRQCS